MNATEKFNALSGVQVSRQELEKLVKQAQRENHTATIYRISKILNKYPKNEQFNIEVMQYPTALAGVNHTGDYREALDDCGRLRKGWKFVKGSVVKVEKKETKKVQKNTNSSKKVQKTQNNTETKEQEQTGLSGLYGLEYIPYEQEQDDLLGLGKAVSQEQIYKMITDKLIASIKQATGKDYVKKWKSKTLSFFIPINFETKKPYRGINFLMLKSDLPNGIFGAFENPYFLTFKQVEKFKGKVKKGAKGKEIIYFTYHYTVFVEENGKKEILFKTFNIKEAEEFLKEKGLSKENNLETFAILKYYKVFNGSDIEGIDFKLSKVEIGKMIPDDSPENKAANLIVKNYPNAPRINHGGSMAYYNYGDDYVQMPPFGDFETTNDYYRTLFHELTHSTGHSSRLNRDFSGRFGSRSYAQEELIAEFGAVFLSAQAGFMWETNKNHAEYLKGWNTVFKIAEDDHKFLMRGASMAQKAADYILNLDENGEPKFYKDLQTLQDKDLQAKAPMIANNQAEKNSEKSLNTTQDFLDKLSEKYKIKSTLLYPLYVKTAKKFKIHEIQATLIKQFSLHFALMRGSNKYLTKPEPVIENEVFKFDFDKFFIKTKVKDGFLYEFTDFSKEIDDYISKNQFKKEYQNQEVKKELEEEHQRIKEKEKEKQKEREKEFYGFLAGKTPLQAGKIKAYLQKKYRYDRKDGLVGIYSNAEVVEFYAKKGIFAIEEEIERIRTNSENPNAYFTSGGYMYDKEVTKYVLGGYYTEKTSYEYSIFLKKQNQDLSGLGFPTAQNAETIAFNKEILKAKREGINTDTFLKLGKTKKILKKYLGTYEMRISQATIKKAMSKDDSHIITWENLINLPDYLNNPLALFKSKTAGFVVLTEIINTKNKPIIAPLHIVKKGDYIEVKSLYSRKNDSTYKKWTEQNLLLYINKKSDLLFKVFKGTIPSVDSKSQCKDTKKIITSKKKAENLSLGLPLTDEIRKQAFTDKGKLRKGWYYDEYGLLTDGKNFFTPETLFSKELDTIASKISKRNDKKIKDVLKNVSAKINKEKTAFLEEQQQMIKSIQKHSSIEDSAIFSDFLHHFTTQTNPLYIINDFTLKKKEECSYSRYYNKDTHKFFKILNEKYAKKIYSDTSGNYEYKLTQEGNKIIDEYVEKNNKLVDKHFGNPQKIRKKYGLSGTNNLSLGFPTAQNAETIAFNKEILKAKREGLKENKAYQLGISKGKLLKVIGKKNITIKGKVIKKVMEKDGDHIATFYHFINLPDVINNPIAIFKSKTQKYSFIVLTELKNYKEKPMIVALHLNKKVEISKIASLYSKRRLSIYSQWYKEGLHKYINKKSKLSKRIFSCSNCNSSESLHSKDTKKKITSKKKR